MTAKPGFWMTPHALDLARTLWDEGLPLTAIAGRIGNGCTASAVAGLRKRRGWPGRGSIINLTPEQEKARGQRAAASKARMKRGLPPLGRSRPARPAPASARSLTPLPSLAGFEIPEPPGPPPAVPAGLVRQCAWPLSNGKPWVFCPAPAEIGSVYCAEHHRRAYVQRSELIDA